MIFFWGAVFTAPLASLTESWRKAENEEKKI